MYKIEKSYYKISDLENFVTDSVNLEDSKKIVSKAGFKIKYYNLAAAFDIETTSTEVNGEKVGLMYVWQFGLNGRCIIGRTWQEFKELLNCISIRLGLSEKRRLVVYVHNLAFEFAFLRKQIKWTKEFLFNGDKRKPIYGVAECGVEFRCSYMLSGLSLEIVGKNLLKYPCEKLVGSLDYTLIRHSKTPLTTEEISYCLADIKVVMSYVQETIELYGSIANVPLTNTGKVRKFCIQENNKRS